MKELTTIKQLKNELKKTHSGVAGDTIFTAKAVMFIAERTDSMDKSLAKIAGRSPISKRWWEFWK